MSKKCPLSREAANTVMNPGAALLAKLGSIIVHVEEAYSNDGHVFDMVALDGLLNDPDVKSWMLGMRAMALLPRKRSER